MRAAGTFFLRGCLRVLLWTAGLPRLAGWARRLRSRGWRAPLRWSAGFSCWESALWTLAFSPRPGGRLAIGVKGTGPALKAHAWVEYPAEPTDRSDEYTKIGTL